MPELQFKDLSNFLSALNTADVPPVILLYGEEYIVKSALGSVLDQICPKEKRAFNYEIFDGGSTDISQLVESLQTHAFFSSGKVVAYLDADIFFSKRNHADILKQAKDAYENDQLRKGANTLLSLLALLNLGLDDAVRGDLKAALTDEPLVDNSDEWLNALLSYCSEKKMKLPQSKDSAAVIERVVEKGFPKQNTLVITTEIVDKRRKLYQSIKERGVVIDCTMPKGNRQADRKAREVLFGDTAKSILSDNAKSIAPPAFRLLLEMTGENLRTFAGNLETLIDYVGARDRIVETDVRAILKRTREDPIFELTGAICDRNAGAALMFLDSLLGAGFYPLQVLSAIINQIRKLLVARDFIESDLGKCWKTGMPFNIFKSKVIAAITQYDQLLSETIAGWRTDDAASAGMGKGRKKGKKATTDLVIAKNPNNAYPVYQLLIKASHFTSQELAHALLILDQADERLKSTGQPPKLILENVILNIIGDHFKSAVPGENR